MPISLRLEKELEERVNRTAHLLRISKTEVIKKSLQKFLSELNMEGKTSFYDFYMKLEGEVPGSGHGLLSVDHRKEVLQKIRGRS
ncbi:MAG: hypothetical protein CO148_00875 [Nitrospirae bacterium CG_4_9_14_3_um_filter_41_27]|nr:MAG: hypothetical protein AUJ63_01820 [Candidatus Pacearchaeota archaeon CG1_02_35_32]PIV42459.1 MAG: hypothetical protein COS27_07115 [Nitrospirae bacterium CG02_land_8_20_14_3_00_41_53]PIW87076.1 MAG: hypothetical protein COZ94_07145 [Nitrospirae bacterium CG_4_8_14_3_um_filter_41_47]PJA81008.1 MAG: hypothetical protein CO148_00875 [Nitrospirae bacterium CG_4_9_14_3_um_filter_41_27]